MGPGSHFMQEDGREHLAGAHIALDMQQVAYPLDSRTQRKLFDGVRAEPAQNWPDRDGIEQAREPARARQQARQIALFKGIGPQGELNAARQRPQSAMKEDGRYGDDGVKVAFVRDRQVGVRRSGVVFQTADLNIKEEPAEK